MKRHVQQSKEPMGASKMLHNLAYVKPALRKLQQQGKEYAPLAGVILEINPEGKEPSGKAIQQQLGISATVYRRWLDALYLDFQLLVSGSAVELDFRDTEHVFYLHGKRETVEFRCRLSVTPRVGEAVEVWFLSAVAGDAAFYVGSISHEYLHDKTVVHISLQAGYYDAYFEQLKARAHFEGKWPREAWDLGEYGQKNLLKKLYPHG